MKHLKKLIKAKQFAEAKAFILDNQSRIEQVADCLLSVINEQNPDILEELCDVFDIPKKIMFPNNNKYSGTDNKWSIYIDDPELKEDNEKYDESIRLEEIENEIPIRDIHEQTAPLRSDFNPENMEVSFGDVKIKGYTIGKDIFLDKRSKIDTLFDSLIKPKEKP